MERDEEIMMRGTKQEMPGFRFRLLRPEKKRELWNPDFELLFLLRGSGRVSYEDGEVHNLPMGSIFAINRFQICDLDLDEDGLALSLCVSAETIDSFHIKLLKCEVKCQSFFYMEDQQEKFDLIRRDMARIFLEMYKNNEEQPIYMKSRVTALLEDLLFYFTSGEKVEQGRGGRERIQRASDYILQHCREEITLEDLADHLYLSRAYISRSFPQYFGVSFREYVTQVRLAHAVQEMHSGATLTEIAYHNGFVNETAMIRAFRKYRGMTPSEYRKQMEYTVKQREKKGKEREEAAGDHDIFQSLLQYAAVTEQEIETINESAVSVTAAVNGRKPRVAGHWKRVINAGYAASVLNREVQDELEQLVQELGYELIRVKGILDDDMCVLRRNMWGEIQFCWNYIDEVIDLLFMQASAFQQEKWQGWSAQSPDLPRHQQLWLDPWRSLSDETFKQEREKNDWQVTVADDFARWLNYRLKKSSFDVGAVEQKEWRSQSLFAQRMREMEAVLQEALK